MSAFVSALLLIVWMLAIVGSAIGALFLWSEFGRPALGIASGVLSIVLFAALIAVAMQHEDDEMNACLRTGRAWAIVGKHTELVYNAALKMSMPEDVTDYGCVERR